jgi:nicotinamide riboside kinase
MKGHRWREGKTVCVMKAFATFATFRWVYVRRYPFHMNMEDLELIWSLFKTILRIQAMVTRPDCWSKRNKDTILSSKISTKAVSGVSHNLLNDIFPREFPGTCSILTT